MLTAIRKTKSDARLSMKAPVARVEVVNAAGRLAWLAQVRADLCEAGQVQVLDMSEGAQQTVRVWL